MKIEITMKDPDGYDYAIEEYVKDVVQNSESDISDFGYTARSEIVEKLSKWFEYSEYVTLEYDTETDTMIVVRLS